MSTQCKMAVCQCLTTNWLTLIGPHFSQEWQISSHSSIIFQLYTRLRLMLHNTTQEMFTLSKIYVKGAHSFWLWWVKFVKYTKQSTVVKNNCYGFFFSFHINQMFRYLRHFQSIVPSNLTIEEVFSIHVAKYC